MSPYFNSVDPRTGEQGPAYLEATPEDVRAVAAAAARMHRSGALRDRGRRAALLRGSASRLRAAGDEIVAVCETETGLPEARLRSELERTAGQLEAFAEIVDAGDDAEAIIDHPDPDAKPIPKPDLRRMRVPLGPVAVFGASNFPLAFSTAGGDTASALAAGCPVIVKGHPSHPGTGERVTRELMAAAIEAGLPGAVFVNLPAAGVEIGEALVDAPEIAAVGFTGSFAGGKAISDRAARREVPIPVYAEMGSVNPIVRHGGRAARAGGQDRPGAHGVGGELRRSAVHEAGRGVRAHRPDGDAFAAGLAARLDAADPSVLLNERLHDALRDAVGRLASQPEVRALGEGGARRRPRLPPPAGGLRGSGRRHERGAARRALRAGGAAPALRLGRRAAGRARARRGPAHRLGARRAGRGREPPSSPRSASEPAA